MLIVAGRAVRRAEFASVRVAVTIGARGVLQTPIATRYGKLRKMAAIARDLRVHPFQWKGGHRMRAKTDSSWQTEPTNVGVAVLAPVAELGWCTCAWQATHSAPALGGLVLPLS